MKYLANVVFEAPIKHQIELVECQNRARVLFKRKEVKIHIVCVCSWWYH